MMFDMLGDRDYDAFEKHQHEHLKEKIAFAFFGPPQTVDESATPTTALLFDCYTDKQKAKINAVYNKICEIYGNKIILVVNLFLNFFNFDSRTLRRIRRSDYNFFYLQLH